MLRGGRVGSASRSRIALKAVRAISRQGWWMVVSGTLSRVAKRKSSKPTMRRSRGQESFALGRVWRNWAAVRSLAQMTASRRRAAVR